jgi:hypothetical protein
MPSLRNRHIAPSSPIYTLLLGAISALPPLGIPGAVSLRLHRPRNQLEPRVFSLVVKIALKVDDALREVRQYPGL